ncbi:MAG: 1-deoxy-D-xylulose-5-phosphate synthase [Candidatus Merdivicinus sp.]|jgi:1-deoxy-D-xylulose-5-phosphate synthase
MEQYPILDRIHTPADIRGMDYPALEQLCKEIRTFLIENVSKTGGHLASNLGTVELTLAIHRIFHTPEDTLIWDVGHQCYTHKIITGRKELFSTLRQPNGISGFPKPSESIYDAFTVGHSSTSISAAYAASCANKMSGNDLCAVAVIGDGAFTGGMAYEALNNAGRSKNNLVIILNHNSMSISRNVGAFARYLSVIRSKPSYLQMKEHIENILDNIPLVGERMKEWLRSSKSLLKFLLYHSTFFEELGFAYYGPVDGHNLPELEQTLRRARELHRPAFVHVETIKGKGYEYAEKSPMAYHGVSRFDIETGNPDVAAADSFSVIFGNILTHLADEDEKICAVTAAMREGTGLSLFAAEHKNRFYDVGIAEQHAMTFCAGLAAKGYRPVFAVYSTFLQRAYDQILHDTAIDRLHVVLAVDRAGLVGDDGETHQGIYDIAYLTSIPGITIFSPATFRELEIQLKRAIYETKGVVAIRYPKGSEPELLIPGVNPAADYTSWNGENSCAVLSYGRIFDSVYHAVQNLEIKPSVIQLHQIYPFSDSLLQKLMSYERIIFFEEAEQNGSISEHLCNQLIQNGYSGKFYMHTLPNAFIRQGKVQQILAFYQLDQSSMTSIMREELAL